MVETKSLVGDLDAGRKLTREALGDAMLASRDACGRARGRDAASSCGSIPHRAALAASPAVLFNPRLSEVLPRPVVDSGSLAWEDPG
jgi:hypothetical protein